LHKSRHKLSVVFSSHCLIALLIDTATPANPHPSVIDFDTSARAFIFLGGLPMNRFTEEFRSVVRSARRVGTPLLAIRTADPASAIAQVCESVNGKQAPPPLLVWDFISGLQGRNEGGKSAVAKLLGESSPAIGPGDALAIAQRVAADAILFFLNPQRVWEQPDVVQGIWNLRDVFKAGGQMLVLVTPPGLDASD
jgi:hypothetical protein